MKVLKGRLLKAQKMAKKIAMLSRINKEAAQLFFTGDPTTGCLWQHGYGAASHQC